MIYNQCENTLVSTIATVVRKTTNSEKFRPKYMSDWSSMYHFKHTFSKNKPNGSMIGGDLVEISWQF